MNVLLIRETASTRSPVLLGFFACLGNRAYLWNILLDLNKYIPLLYPDILEKMSILQYSYWYLTVQTGESKHFTVIPLIESAMNSTPQTSSNLNMKTQKSTAKSNPSTLQTIQGYISQIDDRNQVVLHVFPVEDKPPTQIWPGLS